MARRTTKFYHEVVELRPPLLALPLLAEEEKVTREVTGSYGDQYIVDLGAMSCTCRDWTDNRVRFPKPDIRRACKHIVKQIRPERFVLKGDRLAGRLVPVPALDYRLGCLDINRSMVVFRCAPMRVWYFEVIAPLVTSPEERDFHATFRTDTYRWQNRFLPKYSHEIKRYLKKWLKNQPEFDEELPPFPQSVLDRFAERERQEGLDNEKCFVCRHQLFFSDKTPEFLYIRCPCCECINVLTRSGRTNTPERLRLYRKYDGDLYDKNYPSLKNQTEREQERMLRLYKKMRAVGELTPFQFEIQMAELERETDARLLEIRKEKERELDRLRKHEREIRDHVHRNQND